MEVGVLFEGGVELLDDEWDEEEDEELEVEVEVEELFVEALVVADVALVVGTFPDGVGVEAEEKVGGAGSDEATFGVG